MPQALPVSLIVNVNLSLTPTPASFPNLNSCLLLGTSTVIDVVTRMREYSSLSDVGIDFGQNAEEYLAAQQWFGQNPQPQTLNIGRWAKTAAAGQLFGGPVSSQNQQIAAWTAIATGGVKFTIDGGAATVLANLNFAAAQNLNGVAAIITTALAGAATVVWNANFERFEATSATAGANSSVSFAQPTGAGVDISAMLAMTAASNGAYQANGIAAETAVAAVNLFQDRFSSAWYGLVIPSAVDADHLAVAAFIEAANPKHYYGVTTQDVNTLNASDTTDIAYQLANAKYLKTAVQFSRSSPYAIMSYLARILTTNWNAANSTITLMFKQEPGVSPETLSLSQLASLRAKNCNVFATLNNNTMIIFDGKSSSGDFTDSVIGCDWFAQNIQSSAFNILYTSPKVSQTDAGAHDLATAVESACIDAGNNGLIAPGQWNGAGVGQVTPGSYLPTGYYVYLPPISSQAQADRAARKAPPITVLAKLGGAIHEADIQVNVNP